MEAINSDSIEETGISLDDIKGIFSKKKAWETIEHVSLLLYQTE
jgi:hypothetical protein